LEAAIRERGRIAWDAHAFRTFDVDALEFADKALLTETGQLA
jgi:hypothetical protein